MLRDTPPRSAPIRGTVSPQMLASFRATPHRFEAPLSDEVMPDMTGSELAREVRRIRPDIPILLTSGYVTSALSERAREIGITTCAPSLW